MQRERDGEPILPPGAVTEFKQFAQPIQVKKKQTIFREADCSSDIYFIENGRVKLYQITKLGQIAVLSIRQAGDMIGISGAVMGGERYVFAEAMEPCRLWKMSRARFLAFVDTRSQWLVITAAMLGQYLHEAQGRIVNEAFLDVNQRLARLLFHLSRNAPPLNNGKVYITPIPTQWDLAGMIGTCRQTVTTVLGKFKDEGIIRVERLYGKRCIEIADLEKLKRYMNHV